SEVAINNNGKIEIIKNIFGDEYTPSVFGIDKAKNKIVGKHAYERLYKDASENEFKNHKSEIKRLMGTSETTHFERTGLDLTPEEISAEILKSLKEDILRKYPDFNTSTAVITVPAAFSILQSEATKRAGNLAGFKHVVLLQEPIAAAVAYGFGNAKNENWLIYDFGGGTFDSALVSLKDGVLSVLGHSGNNFLGGKNIDWEIVDKIIVPKIIEKFTLDNFNRGNKKYQVTFANLKYIAETAKIYLSQFEKGSIEIDNIGKDDDDKEIYLLIDFSRKEFEELIKPLIDQTIKLAKETLKESGIKNNDVKKTILVGGPTQIPYIRERLKNDLKISVDSSADPLTVVARGAAIFAISQKIPKKILNSKIKKGVRELNLHYETLTSETEQMITGAVNELKDTNNEYYIQIQSESKIYSGSKIKLKNGKFSDTVAIEPNKSNLYWIYLFDKDGSVVPVDPDSFTITNGLSVPGAPLPHSIGIVLAQKDIKNNFVVSNEREIIWEKGSSLPLNHHGTYKTVRKLKKNDDNPLNIFIDQGESDIPDENTYVCQVLIRGEDLPYDLPEKTEVEITVELDESRQISVTVDIPLIDLIIKECRTSKDEVIDMKNLEIEFNVQKEKARTISENCTAEERKTIEDMIQSVKTSVNNAHIDEDEKQKARSEMKNLKITLGKIEKEKEMPQLIKEFNNELESTYKLVNEYGDEKDKDSNNDQLSKMKAEGKKAIDNKDKTLLSKINEQITKLGIKAWFSNSQTWHYYFQQLRSENHNFSNEKESQYYFDKGQKAIESGNEEELKRCVQSLWSLLPKEEQVKAKKNLSGITK
ncbi:MAG: Hsp70 family protein, partial [Parcubacteria group bacterium]|nr:Hsp70 family protein [Parcubacteria group bacterium]